MGNGIIQMALTLRATLIIISQREPEVGISKMETKSQVFITRPKEWTQMLTKLSFLGRPLPTSLLSEIKILSKTNFSNPWGFGVLG